MVDADPRNPRARQIVGRDVLLEVGAELIEVSPASLEDLAHRRSPLHAVILVTVEAAWPRRILAT
jgi:hypothetical protein